MRSELPWVRVAGLVYAEGVVANTLTVGNNPVGVRHFADLDPGSSLRIATLGYAQ